MARFLISLCSFFAVTNSLCCTPKYGEIPNPSPQPDPISPETFTVQFLTDVENGSAAPIVLFVNRSWAPLGADRFYSLIQDGYYDCAAFFRVVPNFVVQFGIAALPEETTKWDTTIPDDPVLVSNLLGTVSFATAGPDTRTTQLFINTVDNAQLDTSGFAPFALVQSGMETVVAITNPTPGNSNGINQLLYKKKGNEWLLEEYPMTNLITASALLI
jgi:peptidyl-prolyl cis-trans isomerase A (cyclophilin A)